LNNDIFLQIFWCAAPFKVDFVIQNVQLGTILEFTLINLIQSSRAAKYL